MLVVCHAPLWDVQGLTDAVWLYRGVQQELHGDIVNVDAAAAHEAAAAMAISQATGAAMQNAGDAVMGFTAGMLGPHPAPREKLPYMGDTSNIN